MAFIDEPASAVLAPSVSAKSSLTFSMAGSVVLAFSATADLVKPPFVEDARALSSTRVRIEFEEPVDNNAALLDKSNYQINKLAAGAIAVSIVSVEEPAGEASLFVDLNVTEMTNGGSYEAVVNPGTPSNPVTGDSVPVPNIPEPFIGVGVLPKLNLVIASSATTAEVRFSENMKSTGAIGVVGSYSFDNGLVVEDVLDVVGNVVQLQTSEQDPALLYQLTVNGVFSDGANNPLTVPVVSPMLGFQDIESFSQDRIQQIYKFLHQNLRDEDQERGQEFLKRYLDGPQAVWDANTQIVLSIPELWDVTKIPDAFLQFLKNIVGWTIQLDSITDALDAATLRRLIANSVAFWKGRGTETNTEDILSLVTASRARVLNWFFYRFIVGESAVGYETTAGDLWTIPFLDLEEGEVITGDEQRYDIRIVDDGALNRQLVVDLAILTRPIGERVGIFYLALMDLFDVVGDNSQWDSNLAVTGSVGRVETPDATPVESVITLDRALEWSSYTTTIRWRVFQSGTPVWAFRFYRAGPQDFYLVRFTPNSYEIAKVVAGVETSIDSGPSPIEFIDGVFYTAQIDVNLNADGVTNAITLSIDANTLAVVFDADQGVGTFSVVAENEVAVEMDNVEVFFTPLQSSFIDVGNVVTHKNFDL